MRIKSKMARGFTLVEVMVALLVFIVSLMGLVALQRASIAGTAKGREHTAGVNLARFVLNWVQSEAATYPISETTLDALNFPVITNGLSADHLDTWQLLPNSDGMRFDAYMGNNGQAHYDDVDATQYCIYYKMSQFISGQTEDEENQYVDEVYKVSVMVNWPKWKQYHEGWADCASRPPLADGSGDGADLTYWDSVELTTVVTREFTSKME